ncbi:hypothetical protein HDU91_002513, partial [Kappamyces sp. JEL0680]
TPDVTVVESHISNPPPIFPSPLAPTKSYSDAVASRDGYTNPFQDAPPRLEGEHSSSFFVEHDGTIHSVYSLLFHDRTALLSFEETLDRHFPAKDKDAHDKDRPRQPSKAAASSKTTLSVPNDSKTEPTKQSTASPETESIAKACPAKILHETIELLADDACLDEEETLTPCNSSAPSSVGSDVEDLAETETSTLDFTNKLLEDAVHILEESLQLSSVPGTESETTRSDPAAEVAIPAKSLSVVDASPMATGNPCVDLDGQFHIDLPAHDDHVHFNFTQELSPIKGLDRDGVVSLAVPADLLLPHQVGSETKSGHAESETKPGHAESAEDDTETSHTPKSASLSSNFPEKGSEREAMTHSFNKDAYEFIPSTFPQHYSAEPHQQPPTVFYSDYSTPSFSPFNPYVSQGTAPSPLTLEYYPYYEHADHFGKKPVKPLHQKRHRKNKASKSRPAHGHEPTLFDFISTAAPANQTEGASRAKRERIQSDSICFYGLTCANKECHYQHE